MLYHLVLVSPCDGGAPDVAKVCNKSSEAWSAMEDAVKDCIDDARPDVGSVIEDLMERTADGWTLTADSGSFKVTVGAEDAIICDGDEITRFALRAVNL